MSQQRTDQGERSNRGSAAGAAAPGAPWLWLSIAAGVLAVAGSVVGLGVGGFYANLTPAFLPQALAQDVANLALAAPALLVCAILALRGSLRARLVWLGVLAFTVYNYVIYTFSIPFGPLFPVWVAVLGLSLFSLIGGIASTDAGAAAARFGSRPAAVVTGWSLIVVGVLFGLLWLSEDVPALVAGTTPQSVLDLGIPTNPVHILDLAFFLPAVVGTGILLLRRREMAYPVAPAFLVFLILTGVPIMVTPIVQSVRGETAAWTVLAPIGLITVLMLVLLAWLLRTVGSPDGAEARSGAGEPAG
ncbi:hypothetical protein [Cryobacterium mannosilyticum]|uniref:Uncharacterized protein n=1 Tax=Cryobacterium mannosilyticum TaxID=1259190 RepID=A0A4R8WGJ9_9MICO|nr:hypothetical protein [Cryobacterium mannosilyticum]TFC06265.1 hypothetical protein E3O32_04005 [Cryobacterium mannosilyticum]